MDEQQEHSIELDEELRLLSPTQKTALLMMLLGEEEAASILTHLEPREVQHLGAAMVSIQEISQEAVRRAVVPRPAKGSSTVSPGRVKRSMKKAGSWGLKQAR